jgi:hypothetical protein
MGSRLENQTFKNREQVMAEFRRCALVGNISQYLCFIFAALGVIGDALNITLLGAKVLVAAGDRSWSEWHNLSHAYGSG